MTIRSFTLILISLAFTLGCTNSDPKPEFGTVEKQEQDPFKDLDLKERLIRHAESQLNIPATEKYTFKIYEEHLNDDGILDGIITINRFEHAQAKAIENNTVSKSAELDFWGNYNTLFYYDSELDKITPPIHITSSANRPLKLNFVQLSSATHKDLILDYPIRNSIFRRYYLMQNHAPVYALQWKLYDGLGTNETEAFCFGYDNGSISSVKDIIVFKGDLEKISPEVDYSKIDPKIECSQDVVHRFFYNPKDNKYYTQKK